MAHGPRGCPVARSCRAAAGPSLPSVPGAPPQAAPHPARCRPRRLPEVAAVRRVAPPLHRHPVPVVDAQRPGRPGSARPPARHTWEGDVPPGVQVAPPRLLDKENQQVRDCFSAGARAAAHPPLNLPGFASWRRHADEAPAHPGLAHSATRTAAPVDRLLHDGHPAAGEATRGLFIDVKSRSARRPQTERVLCRN